MKYFYILCLLAQLFLQDALQSTDGSGDNDDKSCYKFSVILFQVKKHIKERYD